MCQVHYNGPYLFAKISKELCYCVKPRMMMSVTEVNCGFPSYPVRSLTSMTELGVNLYHLPMNRATKDAEWLNLSQSVHPGY